MRVWGEIERTVTKLYQSRKRQNSESCRNLPSTISLKDGNVYKIQQNEGAPEHLLTNKKNLSLATDQTQDGPFDFIKLIISENSAVHQAGEEDDTCLDTRKKVQALIWLRRNQHVRNCHLTGRSQTPAP